MLAEKETNKPSGGRPTSPVMPDVSDWQDSRPEREVRSAVLWTGDMGLIRSTSSKAQEISGKEGWNSQDPAWLALATTYTRLL